MIEIGETIAERYQIRRHLGQGELAQVYLAYDQRLGSLVALKDLRPDLASNAVFLRRFRWMLSLAPALEHPHLVRSRGLEQTRDHAFFIADHVPGCDLRAYLQGHPGPAPFAEAMLIWRAVAAAVAYLHAQGVSHGHLVASNVLLSQEGQVFVSDARLALLTAQALDASQDPTPRAPREDLYNLAALLYTLLTGSPPREDIAPPSAIRPLPDLSPEAETALLRALSADPEQRPATTQQLYSQVLARDLEAAYPASPLIAALVQPEPDKEPPATNDLRRAARKLVAFFSADAPATGSAAAARTPAIEAEPEAPSAAVEYTVGWPQLVADRERLNAQLQEAGAALVEGRWRVTLDICTEILRQFPQHIAAQTLAREAAAALQNEPATEPADQS